MIKKVIELSVEGAKIVDLCIEGDKLLEQGTGAVYNKSVKGVKVNKGACAIFFGFGCAHSCFVSHLVLAPLYLSFLVGMYKQALHSQLVSRSTTPLHIFHHSRKYPLLCIFLKAIF